MTWEQPTALWLLLTIVLLLFARSRTPQQRIAVANLFLWADLETRQMSDLSRRLRRHWLVILQAAFVACVVIALARPVISFGGQPIAIVLDVSMSMGARDGAVTRLETAKARALALVRELPRGVVATIWLSGPEATALGDFARSDATLERALQPVRSTDAAAELDIAIEQARAAEPTTSRIYVISDAAPTDAPDVEWLPVGAPADNASIKGLEARRNVHHGTVALLAAVRNHGATSMSGELVITRGGSVLSRRTLHLPAAQDASVVFELPDLNGVVMARLEVSDALAADNQRFTIVMPDTPLRVRLIGRNHWVEQALAAHPDVMVFAPGPPPVGDEPEVDLVVCASCDEIPADPRAGILLLPPPPTGTREPATVVVTEGTHPLLRGLNADGAWVSPIEIGRPVDGAAVLAHAATLPVILAHDHDDRRIVELRFDPAASGITGEVAFPLLVANAVEWLSAPKRGPAVLVAGEPLRHFLNGNAGDAAAVTGPDGRVFPARRTGAELVSGNTAVAGIYRLTTEDQEFEFVVNPAVERESDLSGSSAQPPAESAPALPDARSYPAGMTHGLLLIALALLALEWLHRAGD